MKKIALLLIFLICVGASAQRIKGVVIDSETNLPVKKAHIQIKDKIVITNKKGKFSFKIPKGWDKTFYVSHISYENQKRTLKEEKELTIKMNREFEILDEVVVVGEKGSSKLAFEKLPDMPSRLHSFASVAKDGKIYVFGGDKTYDQRWFELMLERANDVPADQVQRQMNGGMLGFFSFAGPIQSRPYYGYSDQLLTYDLKKKRWTEENIKVRKRSNHKAVSLDDKIYIIGGKRLSTNKRKEYLDEKVEVFNPVTKTLEIDDTNPHRAVDMEIITYKGKLFTFGGTVKVNIHGKKYFSRKVHSYNPETGDWFLLAEVPISDDTTTLLVDNTVYFFGGFKEERTNMIVTLNLETGKLKSEGKLFHEFEKPSVARKDQTIYIFENSKLLTLDINTKELKEYRIDLPLFGSKIYVEGDDLLVLGGFKKQNYKVRPQREFYKVDLNQLPKTRARKYTRLN